MSNILRCLALLLVMSGLAWAEGGKKQPPSPNKSSGKKLICDHWYLYKLKGKPVGYSRLVMWKKKGAAAPIEIVANVVLHGGKTFIKNHYHCLDDQLLTPVKISSHFLTRGESKILGTITWKQENGKRVGHCKMTMTEKGKTETQSATIQGSIAPDMAHMAIASRLPLKKGTAVTYIPFLMAIGSAVAPKEDKKPILKYGFVYRGEKELVMGKKKSKVHVFDFQLAKKTYAHYYVNSHHQVLKVDITLGGRVMELSTKAEIEKILAAKKPAKKPGK